MAKRMLLVASSGERPGTGLYVLQSIRQMTLTAMSSRASDGDICCKEMPYPKYHECQR